MFKKLMLLVLSISILSITFFNSHDLHRRFIRSKVGSETVMIMNLKNTSGGTGFYLRTKDGVKLITNRHVCELATDDKLNIIDEGSRLSKVGIVKKIDSKHDLCMVEVKDDSHKGLSLASSVSLGEELFIVGHPNLRPLVVQEGEVIDLNTDSIIMHHVITPANPSCKWDIVAEEIDIGITKLKVNFCVVKDRVYRIAAIAFGGNSGSSVVNKYGNVIGVLFAGNTQVVNDTMIVKLEDLREFIN